MTNGVFILNYEDGVAACVKPNSERRGGARASLRLHVVRLRHRGVARSRGAGAGVGVGVWGIAHPADLRGDGFAVIMAQTRKKRRNKKK